MTDYKNVIVFIFHPRHSIYPLNIIKHNLSIYLEHETMFSGMNFKWDVCLMMLTLASNMLMSSCTCVHKIYVKILYIIHKIHHPFNHKWDQESNQDHPGLREGPVGMGNAIRGDENHDFIKVTSWSKSIEVSQFESVLLYSVDFDLAFTGPDTVYDEY